MVALLVPEGMAYAQLAGVPPETAFYAAPAGLILYALLGTSRQLVVAVSSAVAVTSASIIGERAATGSAEFITLTAALALITGLVMVVAGLLRFGQLSQFFSESVLTGFVFGLALVIAIKQLPKMLGLESGEGNFFQRLVELIEGIPEAHARTVIVGLSSLVVMLVLERWFERIPAALVTLVYGIVVSALFGLEERGVEVVGDIPSGLAAPAIPDLVAGDIGLLVAGGLGLGLLAFAEAIGPARQFASRHVYQVDPDQEMIAIGAANAGAGLFQGFAIGASLSKSAANDRAGARTPVSLVVAALATMGVALFLTPLFAPLPEATLGAIVVVAVSGMANVPEMRRLWSLRKVDFVLAMGALTATLLLEALLALGIAVAMSLLLLIWRVSRPNVSELGRLVGGDAFGDVDRHPESRTVPGLLLIRPNSELFFANAAGMRSAIVGRVQTAEPPVQVVLLDLEMTYELDVPGADMLNELNEDLERLGTTLMLARVHATTRDMLDSAGITDVLGQEAIFKRLLDGLINYLSAEGADSSEAELVADSLQAVLDALEDEGDLDAAGHVARLRARLEELQDRLRE